MSEEHLSKAGRFMFLIAWIIVFGVLFSSFYYFGQPGSTVITSTANEFRLGADYSGHYRIKGRINDHPVEFLVDTGATWVAIPQNIATELGISGKYPVTMTTANGEVTGSLTRIDQLTFGSFTLHDVKAVIMPKEDDTVLLGMNVLSQFSMEQQDNQLIFKRQRNP